MDAELGQVIKRTADPAATASHSAPAFQPPARLSTSGRGGQPPAHQLPVGDDAGPRGGRPVALAPAVVRHAGVPALAGKGGDLGGVGGQGRGLGLWKQMNRSDQNQAPFQGSACSAGGALCLPLFTPRPVLFHNPARAVPGTAAAAPCTQWRPSWTARAWSPLRAPPKSRPPCSSGQGW